MDIAGRLAEIQQEIQTVENEKLQREQTLGLFLGASACSRPGGSRTNDAIPPGPHSRSYRQEEGAPRRTTRAHCACRHPR